MSLTFVPFASVAVFGGMAVDRIAVTAAAPTLHASNPGTVRATPGGVGFNVAVSLARLGLGVRLAGALGDDPDGRMMLAAATEAGVDTGLTLTDRGRSTATYQAVFDDRGDLVVGVADTAIYEALDPAAVAAAADAARSDGFWVVDANFPDETLAFLLGAATAAGCPLAALPISPAKATRFAKITERPTLLFANRREAAAILGYSAEDSRPEALAVELARNGFAHSVVTDSAGPLHVAGDGAIERLIPPVVAVASVNGAGDALAAATIYGLSLGRDLHAAVRLGLAAAALTVESRETVRRDLTPDLLAARMMEGAVS